jgi:ribosomal protein S18
MKNIPTVSTAVLGKDLKKENIDFYRRHSIKFLDYKDRKKLKDYIVLAVNPTKENIKDLEVF